MFDFSGKTAIITGGTRGLGAAMTEMFLTNGAKVIATYVSNDEKALSFKSSLGDMGERLELRKFNLADSEAVNAFFHDLESKDRDVHILVNNGGIRRDGIAATMPTQDWDQVIATNLNGSFYMAKGAIPLMMKNRFGRIINISSIGGLLGLPGQTNYSASKAGQIAMVKSLAKEVGKKGITVNAILPGFIETEMTGTLPPEQIKEYKKDIPMRRFGKASEVADLVAFLSSDRASYIHGASLEITGGL